MTEPSTARPTQSPRAANGTSGRGSARRHAAGGGRILAAGLSTAAALVFTGTIANAARSASPTDTPNAPAPITVHVVLTDGRTVDTTVAAPPTLAAAPAALPASARSRAS
jgi:hypothetical protein